VPVVYDGVGKDTLMSSLDSLSPRGLLVSCRQRLGPGASRSTCCCSRHTGSLYVTRPTLLNSYTASRCRPAGNRARTSSTVVASGKVEVPVEPGAMRWPMLVTAHVDLEARPHDGHHRAASMKPDRAERMRSALQQIDQLILRAPLR